MAEWDNTIVMEMRLEEKGKICYRKEQSYYRTNFLGITWELPIIHRDTPIIGGVYLGHSEREAIFVSHYSKELRRLKEEAKKRASYNGNIQREKILQGVFDTVSENIPPNKSNKAKVKEIITKHNPRPDGLLSIDTFIQEHAGTCRHQAIACGALIELLNQDEELKKINAYPGGKASIDRNRQRNSHCWARYTSDGGLVTILDVATRFFGILNDALTQQMIADEIIWPYNRPDEIYFL